MLQSITQSNEKLWTAEKNMSQILCDFYVMSFSACQQEKNICFHHTAVLYWIILHLDVKNSSVFNECSYFTNLEPKTKCNWPTDADAASLKPM